MDGNVYFEVSSFPDYGKLSGNIFLQENTTKLLTDNIYSNNKIAEFIDLSYTLNDIKLDNSVES